MEAGKVHITLASNYFAIKSYETKSEMSSYLNFCDLGSILLGEDAQQSIHFYTLTIYEGSSDNRFGVGVISDSTGSVPHVLALPSNKEILIGFNKRIAVVDFAKRIVKYQFCLDSSFFRFIHLKNIVLVFHEIGVIALNESCNEIWRYDGDIIEDYEIENEDITLRMMDNQTVKITVSSGDITG
jgi:hypothetical protein